nr:unnamed protein product [Callosobruchus analis]
MGLEISQEKTKFMAWTNEQFNKGQMLKVSTKSGTDLSFQEVDRFVYLRTVFKRKPETIRGKRIVFSHTIGQQPNKTTTNEPKCKEVGEGVYPSEFCDQYYRCSKALFWYSVSLDTCPPGQIFKEEAKGCVVGKCDQELVTPPVCDQTGPGYFVARKCNQYYQCSKVLFWNKLYLKTCGDGKIYDAYTQKCVIGTCDDNHDEHITGKPHRAKA